MCACSLLYLDSCYCVPCFCAEICCVFFARPPVWVSWRSCRRPVAPPTEVFVFLLPLEKKKGSKELVPRHTDSLSSQSGFFFLVVHVFYSANGSQREPFLPVDLMGAATSDVHTPSCSELLLSQQLVSVSALCLQY